MNRRRFLLNVLAGTAAVATAAACYDGYESTTDDCEWAEPDGEACDGDIEEPCRCTWPDGVYVEFPAGGARPAHPIRPVQPARPTAPAAPKPGQKLPPAPQPPRKPVPLPPRRPAK